MLMDHWVYWLYHLQLTVMDLNGSNGNVSHTNAGGRDTRLIGFRCIDKNSVIYCGIGHSIWSAKCYVRSTRVWKFQEMVKVTQVSTSIRCYI
jgi:hypothetical protein